MAAIYGATSSIERLHHRYAINPKMIPGLEKAGLVISATAAESRSIVDGIEMKEGFFASLQGHPELSSRSGNPHPLLCSFLKSAVDHQAASHPES
jgi:CTP synthase